MNIVIQYKLQRKTIKMVLHKKNGLRWGVNKHDYFDKRPNLCIQQVFRGLHNCIHIFIYIPIISSVDDVIFIPSNLLASTTSKYLYSGSWAHNQPQSYLLEYAAITINYIKTVREMCHCLMANKFNFTYIRQNIRDGIIPPCTPPRAICKSRESKQFYFVKLNGIGHKWVITYIAFCGLINRPWPNFDGSFTKSK